MTIEELKEIHSKMTPGKYQMGFDDGSGPDYVTSVDPVNEVVCKCDPYNEHHAYDPLPETIAANVAGIAALRNHAIPLIEQLEREKKDAERVAWNNAINAAISESHDYWDIGDNSLDPLLKMLESLKKPDEQMEVEG